MLYVQKRVNKIGATGLAILLLLGAIVSLSCSIDTPTRKEPSPASEPGEDYIPNQIIVKFKSGTPMEIEMQLNQHLGAKVIYTSPTAGFKVLQIPKGMTVPEMVALYSEQPIVEYAEPNYIDHTSRETN